VQLQWATYYDAADQSGLSRIYGGIHPAADDGPGRMIGAKVGRAAFREATSYLDGSILQEFTVGITRGATTVRITWRSIPGYQYKVQWAGTLNEDAFRDLTDFQTYPAGDASEVDGGAFADSRFYRVVRIPG